MPPYSKERSKEINHGSVSREENQQAWADRQRYERSDGPQIDRVQPDLAKSRLAAYPTFYQVAQVLFEAGTAQQAKLAERMLQDFFLVSPRSGFWRAPSFLWLDTNRREYGGSYGGPVNLEGFYKSPLGKEVLDLIQDLLGSTSPLTPPPPGVSAKDLFRTDALPQEARAAAMRVDKAQSHLANWEQQAQDFVDDFKHEVWSLVPDDSALRKDKQGVRTQDPVQVSVVTATAGALGDYAGTVPENVQIPIGFHFGLRGYVIGRGFTMAFGVFPFLDSTPEIRLVGMTLQQGGRMVMYQPILGSDKDPKVVSHPHLADFEPQRKYTYQHIPLSTVKSAISLSEARAKLKPFARQTVDEVEKTVLMYETERKEQEQALAQERLKQERLRQEQALAQERLKQEKEEARRLKQEELSSSKTVVDSAVAEKVEILDRLIAQGAFAPIAQKAKDTYMAGGNPSEDDLRALRNVMYRSRMKDEANQFRAASTPSAARVAARYDHQGRWHRK